MLVSIIIPTYNRAEDLDRCLLSLTLQTVKDFEVLVCDDGSKDNTSEVVAHYTEMLNIHYFYLENFGGPARPRNVGLKNMNGKYAAFLDSDDWWYPTKLEMCMREILNYDIVYHNLDKCSKGIKTRGEIRGRVLETDIKKDLLINGNGIPLSSVVIRKTVIDKTGYFTEDKNLIAMEDVDYWIQVSGVTNKFHFIQESLGAYNVGDNLSVSEKQYSRDIYLFDKYKECLNDDEQQLVLKLLTFKNARVLHKVGKYSLARKEYSKTIRYSDFTIKLKSIIGILACTIHYKI